MKAKCATCDSGWIFRKFITTVIVMSVTMTPTAVAGAAASISLLNHRSCLLFSRARSNK